MILRMAPATGSGSDMNDTKTPASATSSQARRTSAGRSSTRLSTYRQPVRPGAAAGLIQSLQGELESGRVEIPGFPDVAMRLNRALRAEDTEIREIVALINSEPGLVSRLLQIANSVAFNRSGKPVGDLKAAVSRLGFKNVWSAASSYSIRQLQQLDWLKPLRPWLAEVWLSSNHVAAICIVVARQFGQLADEAMVTGLLHRVGELYLLTHAHKRGVDVQRDQDWETVLRQWQPTIGEQIVSQWGLPIHISAAVGRQDAVANDDLSDLPPFAAMLSAAKLYNQVRDLQAGEEAAEAKELLAAVELWGQPFLKLVADGHEQIEAIRREIS
ncbi:MAG: HDOD domain-containing protein [Gammaproteobacteria bacterium]|nr:MAG: HDOD domain-containing protein [Gammaproteobacteria bacterium]